MTIDIPILIPVKGHSERCKGKNHKLLPFAARYIHAQGMAAATTVITDSMELVKLAGLLGLGSHFESREDWQDELQSCWNYVEEKEISLFFLSPVTQPFKAEGLFSEILSMCKQSASNWDFITTISVVHDRRLFYVKNAGQRYQFKEVGQHRKGNLCNTELMIDGVLYLIKSSFLKAVVESSDANRTFWKGNFTCVLNQAPFMDIDTQEDMRQFEFLYKYFSAGKGVPDALNTKILRKTGETIPVPEINPEHIH